MAFTKKRRDEERSYNRFTDSRVPFHCTKKLYEMIDKFLAKIKVQNIHMFLILSIYFTFRT